MLQTAADAGFAGGQSRAEAGATAWAVVALIAVTLVVRLVVSAVFGLDFMESYGVAVARHPSLSYFDQPPLTWWLIGATIRLFGTEAAAVVRLPFILVFAGSTWLMFDMGRRLFGARAGFFGACAFALAPLFGIYDGGLAQTDCLMEFFALAAVRCLVPVLLPREPAARFRWSHWIGAGLCFGLALASKYIAVLLLPGLLAFLLTRPEGRRLLATPRPYVAGVAALLPLLPVLVWNAEHGWASFLYQGARATPGDGLHVVRLLRWLGMQVLILQPWIFAAALAVLVAALRRGPRQPASWLLACLALLPLLVFPLAMLVSSHPLRGFHWGSTGYLPLFPLIGAAVDGISRRRPSFGWRWLAVSAATYALVLAALVTHALTGWMGALAPRAFATQDPVLLELFDWTDLPTTLAARGVDPATTFVTATRWEECAKAAYALKNKYRLLCLADDNIHFSFIADPAAFAGQDAIVVDRYADLDAVRQDLAGHFTSVEPEPPITLDFAGRTLATLKAYRATRYDGTWVVAPPGSRGRQ